MKLLQKGVEMYHIVTLEGLGLYSGPAVPITRPQKSRRQWMNGWIVPEQIYVISQYIAQFVVCV